jgi:hypothetical protein
MDCFGDTGVYMRIILKCIAEICGDVIWVALLQDSPMNGFVTTVIELRFHRTGRFLDSGNLFH